MKKVTIRFALFTLLILLTSQVAHAGSNREIARLGRGTATSLAWRPDGKVVAVGSATGVWLLDEELTVLSNPNSLEVKALSWSLNGDKVAVTGTNSNGCDTQVWDGEFQQVITDLPICGDRLDWSPNSAYLAILQREQSSIHIFDVNKAVELLVLVGDDLIWSPDSSELITSRYSTSSSDISEIAIEDIASGKATNYNREIYPSMPLSGITIDHTLLTLLLRQV